MQRRAFLKGLAAAGIAPLLAPAQAEASLLATLRYRALVPEIFRPLPNPPTHSDVLVIGSGFGGAVSALRMTQAGLNVTMLERGSRWPTDPQRKIFASDALPDGRGFWFRNTFTGVSGIPQIFDRFGGVLDVTRYGGIDVWRGAAVGGGSVVYTGATVQPERRFFDHVFQGQLDYDEFDSVYYPRVRQELGSSLMPDDIYASSPYSHSRTWDQQSVKAGYEPQLIEGNWNWDTMRKELRNQVRDSATVGETNLGNSNGVKQDLTQNYLKRAEATGLLNIYPGHVVTQIGRNSAGRYTITVNKQDPTGRVLSTRTLTANMLVLAAGSIGTSELLVKAKAMRTLPNLNDQVGQGWGSNGDAALVRSLSPENLLKQQGVASRSRILDESGDLPVTLENWFIPLARRDFGLIGSLGMTLDPTRSRFAYNSRTRNVDLLWRKSDSQRSVDALRAVHNRICKASGVIPGVPFVAPDVQAGFTAHPLGGVVLGQATDNFGRVHGYNGLYVMDGAAIPGNTGTVNPSLTIAALAERNIETIIAAGS